MILTMLRHMLLPPPRLDGTNKYREYLTLFISIFMKYLGYYFRGKYSFGGYAGLRDLSFVLVRFG